MSIRKQRAVFAELLAEAGVTLNGGGKADVQVHNEDLYGVVLAKGSLGLGESYMDGWWDAEEVDSFFDKVLSARLETKVNKNFAAMLEGAKARLFNQQNKELSKRVAEEHYDLGNDLYEKMLDSRMQYTCAYWKRADNLEDAQKHKLDLICKKLQLKESDTVLELGCGWGGFAKFAAENYGCHVTAYNISKEQVAWATEKCQGLPVEFRLQDYREASGQYDKVASIGLCEHIGYKNYNGFLKVIHNNLKDYGLALIHTIGGNHTVVKSEPWLDRYIFPGSMLPSPQQFSKTIDRRFVLEDWHNFGVDYDTTLMAWYDKFNQNWNSLKSERYNDRFYRMWKYYLLLCAGSFRSRKNQLWQVVISKHGLRGGYESIR
ncbi:MAG: cyclopropane fatty acyl phospholipid synthase [Fibrobacteria bacterium]|nr:cyclopropane fatty acyl phospholipid synthase [Fibrobacteria bacterium]